MVADPEILFAGRRTNRDRSGLVLFARAKWTKQAVWGSLGMCRRLSSAIKNFVPLRSAGLLRKVSEMRSSTWAFLGLTGVGVAVVVMILLRPDSASNVLPLGEPSNESLGSLQSESQWSPAAQPSVSDPAATSINLPPVEDKIKLVEATPHVATPVVPLKFPTWPTPKLALVATGEQLGYFEPCGCTANQLGGMSRRASLFEKIRSLGWDVRGIDVGSVSRRTGAQAKLKFETTLEALRELKYVALGLGPEELKFEAGYLLSQHLSDGDEPLKFLGANLTFFGAKDFGTPLSSAIFEVNGIKVGVTSVMSDSIRKTVIPDMTLEETANAEMLWTDPSEALTSVLQEFADASVTVRILLAQTTLEESKKLAADFPTLTLIVRANGFGEGSDNAEMVGSVQLIEVGKKGKAAGVIGLYPDDAENPVRFELVPLSGELFSDSERMTQLMQGYQDRLKSEAIAKNDGTEPHPSGAIYVGAAKCGECHTKAYAIWKNTPHAHAFESLDPSFQRKGFERLQGVNKTFDPECIACHVTGWDPEEYLRYESGFVNEEFAADDAEKLLQGLLAGNQCENCHGPGNRHVEYIEADNKVAAINEVKVTLLQAEQTCNKCHDGDNSPGFKFEKYWEDVKHYGTD